MRGCRDRPPIKPTNFLKYAKSPLLRYVLPIIPVGAQLKATSKIKPELLGKIPGVISGQNGEWTGFDWPSNATTQGMLMAWQAWQSTYNVIIPLATRLGDMVVVIDLDIENEHYLNAVRNLATTHLGETPVVRRRDGSIRCVLFYRHKAGTPPIRKFAGAYVDEQGQKQLIETLGTGQQVVLEGPHAKGAMHYWEGDRELVDHLDEIPEITSEMVSAFYMELDAIATAAFGFTKHKLALPTGSNRAAAVSITNLMSPHRASDMDLLARAIRAIDINDPRLADYDPWCALFRAMWAACGGDRQFYDEHIWPWLADNSANNPEEMELKLASFKDSQLGAEYVYGIAADFGFNEGRDALAREEFDGVDPLPELPADSGACGPDTSSAGAGANLPSGPIPPSDTHWQLAAAFVDLHGREWRYNVDAKRWFRFDQHVWQPSDVAQDVVGAMLAERGLQIYQTAAGSQAEKRYRVLQSWGTTASVMKVLQGHPQMVVREADFDAHPHLLNTPAGVIDLRTGKMSDHDPTLLIRNITLVSPNYLALNSYEDACPRFFKVLQNAAVGRPWVIPAIRAWFAYCLTGALKHQALLFLHGPPGVGKSLIIQILFDLLHTYSLLLDESFFSKNGGDAKRFDMANIVGKRLLFMDETQLGMTWDETRASKGASAKRLSAEIKFGRTIQFDNTAKICIVGNHKPNFVAADTGGLTSRMLLLEAGGINYREPKNKGIDGLSDIIVAEEGPAILMWALEACVADYCTRGLFDELMEEAREAAKAYAMEDSTLRQWVADEMCERPDLSIDTMEAFRRFLDFAKGISSNNRAPNIKLSAFKQALKAAFPSIEFGKRTSGSHPNRSYIKGFGYAQAALTEADNVVPLILNPSTPKTPKSEER
jgi:P4 family phage/plasmid primase-like protien